MKTNRLIISSLGLFATLGASLEEVSAAEHKKQFQNNLEQQRSLPSDRNPTMAVEGWKQEETQINQRSRTLSVKTQGTSNLDAITRQARQFSKSLRRDNNLSEGFFSAPGQIEFSEYVISNDSNDNARKSETAEKLRTATIASITRLIKQPGRQQQRVELLMRLSELYAERYSYYLQSELSTYEAAHERWEKGLKKGPEPVFNQKRSLSALGSATEILRKLVNQYPNHPKTPEALYQLGFMLTELKSESAVLYFKRLIERFPKSKFVQDANLALGEFYFARNSFNDALSYYQKALSDRGHRSYPYAVYKLGWTFFNIRGDEQVTRQNLNKSLLAFKLLIKVTGESSNSKKNKTLRKDAMRDMVLVYADLGDTSGAKEYFGSVNEPDLYVTLLERLAWLHAEAGRNKESAELYRQLVSDFPKNSKNPDFLLRMAALYEKEQHRGLLVEHLERAHLMTQSSSDWYKAQSNPKTIETAQSNVSRELAHWSQKLHSEFQKSKNPKTALSSLAIYDLALKKVPESDAQFSLLFNRAQLLTSLNRHSESITGYLAATALDEKLKLKRPEVQVGLENAIAEGEILLKQIGDSKKVAQARAFHENRLITAIDTHVRLFPRDKERINYMHRAAWLVFQGNRIDDAQKRWLDMAKINPAHALVGDGLRLLVKKSFDSRNWLKAGQDSKMFLSIRGVKTAPVGAQLFKLHKVAYFQYAMNLEKQKKHTEAAKLFSDFQKSFATDPDAPKALINAANNYFKASQPDDALGKLKFFVRAYPDSALKTKALELTIGIAQSLGQFPEAAQSLEILAQQKISPEATALNLKMAAEYRLATGEQQKAVSNARAALAQLRAPEDICSTYKIIIDGQQSLRQADALTTAKEAAQRCSAISPQWSIYFSGVSATLALERNQVEEASKMSLMALNRGQSTKGRLDNPFAFEGLHLAGSVQLSILEEKSKELVSKRITDAKSIQVEFGKIKNSAQTLAQQYSTLARFSQPETSVAALYRVGELQDALANILVQAPNPSGVSEQEVEGFRSRIEKIALPLQEEASSLYAQALERAHDAEVVTSYTDLIQNRLAQTRPGEYQRRIESMPAPAYIGHEFPITQETKGVFKEED